MPRVRAADLLKYGVQPRALARNSIFLLGILRSFHTTEHNTHPCAVPPRRLQSKAPDPARRQLSSRQVRLSDWLRRVAPANMFTSGDESSGFSSSGDLAHTCLAPSSKAWISGIPRRRSFAMLLNPVWGDGPSPLPGFDQHIEAFDARQVQLSIDFEF